MQSTPSLLLALPFTGMYRYPTEFMGVLVLVGSHLTMDEWVDHGGSPNHGRVG